MASEYQGPGSAALDAFTGSLAQAAALRRQAMLDKLTQDKEQLETQRIQMENQRLNAETDNTHADRVAKRLDELQPGDIPDAAFLADVQKYFPERLKKDEKGAYTYIGNNKQRETLTKKKELDDFIQGIDTQFPGISPDDKRRLVEELKYRQLTGGSLPAGAFTPAAKTGAPQRPVLKEVIGPDGKPTLQWVMPPADVAPGTSTVPPGGTVAPGGVPPSAPLTQGMAGSAAAPVAPRLGTPAQPGQPPTGGVRLYHPPVQGNAPIPIYNIGPDGKPVSAGVLPPHSHIANAPGASVAAAKGLSVQTGQRAVSRLEDDINEADKAGLLGPAAGRLYSMFAKAGSTGDPRLDGIIGHIKGDLVLTKMHIDAGIGGSRAAASPLLMKNWEDVAISGSKDLLLGYTRAIKDDLQDSQPGSTPTSAAPHDSAATPATKKVPRYNKATGEFE